MDPMALPAFPARLCHHGQLGQQLFNAAHVDLRPLSGNIAGLAAAAGATVRRLDETNFERHAMDPDAFAETAEPLADASAPDGLMTTEQYEAFLASQDK